VRKPFLLYKAEKRGFSVGITTTGILVMSCSIFLPVLPSV